MGGLERELRALPHKNLVQVLAVLKQIRNRDIDGLDHKKLKGYDCIFRVRTGRYRIIYFDDEERLEVKAIRKRDESTYRNF
ncbi:MAG: hypothetical protein O2904_02935 [bacterium]|nr:hypothetical protein [bacterium]